MRVQFVYFEHSKLLNPEPTLYPKIDQIVVRTVTSTKPFITLITPPSKTPHKTQGWRENMSCDISCVCNSLMFQMKDCFDDYRLWCLGAITSLHSPPPHLTASIMRLHSPPPHLTASITHLHSPPPHLTASITRIHSPPPHLTASITHLHSPPPHLTASITRLHSPPPHLIALFLPAVCLV